MSATRETWSEIRKRRLSVAFVRERDVDTQNLGYFWLLEVPLTSPRLVPHSGWEEDGAVT
jgi:hypothetical protein